MAGRGLRPATNKSNLRLLDHSGAVWRHGALEDPVGWVLSEDIRAKNLTHSQLSAREQRDRFVDCSQCGALRTAGEACPNCGFLPKRRGDAITFRDGELAQVNAGGRTVSGYGPEERVRWHGMLAWIRNEKHARNPRGCSPGWIYHKYLEKFGVKPPWGMPTPIEPTLEVRSWVRSRDIAYAKGRAKAGAVA